MRGSKWSDEQRREAVAVYCVSNIAQASRVTGIPDQTLCDWKNKQPDWWERVEAEVYSEHGHTMRTGCYRGVEKGLLRIYERIEHGEPIVDKEGNITGYKPVALRDLVIATGTLFDKLRILEGKPTSISGKADATAAEKLEELRQWARAQEGRKAA